MKFNGLKVIVDDVATINSVFEQFRFPRSRKRRIRKKWTKIVSNSKTFIKRFYYQIGDTIVMHSEDFKKLKIDLVKQEVGSENIR